MRWRVADGFVNRTACFNISLLWSKRLRSEPVAASIFHARLAFGFWVDADLLRQHLHHQQRVEIFRSSFAGAGRAVENDRRRGRRAGPGFIGLDPGVEL